jgi:hypothetical protein
VRILEDEITIAMLRAEQQLFVRRIPRCNEGFNHYCD